ncbi:uncharacterized protein LOC123404069 isoform X2 [Hordeum vulgare subsp. vulgare]|uniref:uncharacterized protein LOC123404069 isoform X2 n=1 Tax=Hordeum vulgare subsp. vulgare TaxID=112509 RepID=UPI001D1A5A74|nr:uncharacterized protein LOC123404069 isoform X2 [Hordeum vulgare subsp. vulgare]
MRSPWARKPVTLSRLDTSRIRQPAATAPRFADAPLKWARRSAQSASSRWSSASSSSSRPSSCSFISDHRGTACLMTPAHSSAGFILLRPLAELAPHAAELQQEINRQIGVPNTKVSVSMQALFMSCTVVEFDVLPDPINTFISTRSMHALRKNLIQLTLQQLNLSLTPTVFGDPLCVQMLGFPGGITIELEPLQHNFIPQVARPVFNVTLDMSIRQLRGLIDQMKEDLGHLLGEDIHIDLTNKNGSTIAPPVIVQVSLSPDDRGIYEQIGRLKQLAEIITESSSWNLGLDTSVFGRIKDLKLAPRLKALVPSFAPSSSPTPMSSPSMPPYSQPSTTNPCAHCSCPAWMKLNATNPHRMLMRLPPVTASLQLPTQRHSGNGPGHKQSGNAMAAPTSIAPSSQP